MGGETAEEAQRDRDTLGGVDAAAGRDRGSGLLGSQLSLGGAESIGIG